MTTTPNVPEPPLVCLPAGKGRTVEALHVLAWRDLLERRPGSLQALAEQAARQMDATAAGLSEDSMIALGGACRSDLFVTCNECHGDRAVIEIKGPTAKLNWLSSHDAWQTVRYRETYQANRALACHHHRGVPAPLLILLDARNRSRQIIEQTEGANEPALDGWAVLTYQEVLSSAPFADHSLARWLLGR